MKKLTLLLFLPFLVFADEPKGILNAGLIADPTDNSIELIQPDALDIAREMGLNIAKFQAKFAEPVYATLGVTVFPVGAKEGLRDERTTAKPMKEHTFSFSMKDYNVLTNTLGFPGKPEFKDTIEFSVFHPYTMFSLREKSPFGVLVPGQSLMTFVERQSMEPLELDKPITLMVKAGPFDKKTLAPKSIKDNYMNAPGFFLFEVTFSKTKPEPAKAEEKAPTK